MASDVTVVRAAYEALARGDVAAVAAAMDPRIEWVAADGLARGSTIIGPDQVLSRVLVPLGDAWDGFAMTPAEFLDAGSAIVVLGEFAGRCRDTGRSLRAPFAHVWRLLNGKLIGFREYTDTALIRQAHLP